MLSFACFRWLFWRTPRTLKFLNQVRPYSRRETGNIYGKTENFNCLLRVNKYKLDSVRQKDPYSVLDKYKMCTTFKFKHCEFNPQQGRFYFSFKRIIYLYFF